MEKNKGLAIGLAGVLVVIGIVIAIVAVNSNKGDDEGKKDGGSSQQQDKDGGEKDDKKTTTITADDLKSVDETVEFGDYDAQFTLTKAIQNGEKVGKVVKIEGEVSHFGAGMSYSVGQRKEEGNQFVGTTFTIEDGEEADYPADGTHVVITGIVVADESGLMNTIQTLKAFVEVK